MVVREVLPAIRGTWLITRELSLVTQWQRIHKSLAIEPDTTNRQVRHWHDWACALHRKPLTERLHAINSRVNRAFRYRSDQENWQRRDYWEAPREAIQRRALDCEGYAILKLYLARLAGVSFAEMEILVGRLPDDDVQHAVLR